MLKSSIRMFNERYAPSKAMKRTPFQRLMSFVQKDEKTGCWIWTGNIVNHYGQMQVVDRGRKTPAKASRLSYEAWKGEISPGKFVLHTCDNRACVCPGHLYLGDHQQNMNDMKDRNRHDCRFGTSHYMSKLTDEDTLRIYLKKGLQKDIAAEFGVSQGTVTDIKRLRLGKRRLNRLLPLIKEATK